MTDLAGQPLVKESKTITWSPLMAEKGGYKHFMLKEIYEQPRALADTIAGRLIPGNVLRTNLAVAIRAPVLPALTQALALASLTRLIACFEMTSRFMAKLFFIRVIQIN